MVLLGGAITGNRLRTALARDLVGLGLGLGMLAVATADRALKDHDYASEPDPESVENWTECANLLRYLADVFGPLRSSGGREQRPKALVGCAPDWRRPPHGDGRANRPGYSGYGSDHGSLPGGVVSAHAGVARCAVGCPRRRRCEGIRHCCRCPNYPQVALARPRQARQRNDKIRAMECFRNIALRNYCSYCRWRWGRRSC